MVKETEHHLTNVVLTQRLDKRHELLVHAEHIIIHILVLVPAQPRVQHATRGNRRAPTTNHLLVEVGRRVTNEETINVLGVAALLDILSQLGAALCSGCKKSLRPTREACYRCQCSFSVHKS